LCIFYTARVKGSDILPTIRVPTLVIHRTDDVTINVEGGRYLAEHIPGSSFQEKIIYLSSETTLERLPTLSKSF
jgi:pimeloyl-ACP methyl ester carboxylesterase